MPWASRGGTDELRPHHSRSRPGRRKPFSPATSATDASTTRSTKLRSAPLPKAPAVVRSTTSGALRVTFTTKRYEPSLTGSSESFTAASLPAPSTTKTQRGPTAKPRPTKKFNKPLDTLRPWGL